MYIPTKIQEIIGNAPYERNNIGLSGSAVACFADKVLKIQPANDNFHSQIDMLRWLEGKIPVPKVICTQEENGLQYLLMSRIPGKMACDPDYMDDPDTLVQLLADALKLLWSVDISNCPRQHTLEDDLREAEERVKNGLVDTNDVEPETFGPGGFESPAALLAWLKENRPPLEPTLSHGDFCLPNVFLQDGRVSGFIDLGDCGISDKWRDVALCHRSLRHNFTGKYARIPRPDFDPDLLFEKLELTPDWEKLRYYLLLDELF